MIKTLACTILAALASAECYRPASFPNEIGAENQKIRHGTEYEPQCEILRNKPCRQGNYEIVMPQEVKITAQVWQKVHSYPESYRQAYLNQDAIHIPELDWMMFTEIEKSHADVEEWTKYKCNEVDFITKEFSGSSYYYWERRHIARYDFQQNFDPQKNDRHHLNNFFIKHGVKTTGKVLTEGPPMVEDTDKLEVEIIQEGEGDKISEESIVLVHYTGKLDDGTVFDSSHKRNQPHKFKQGIGAVMKCWDQAIVMEGMKKGTVAQITCPASLAYGINGNSHAGIKPNTTIYFDIEIIDFRP